jgi:hypothetical protein
LSVDFEVTVVVVVVAFSVTATPLAAGTTVALVTTGTTAATVEAAEALATAGATDALAEAEGAAASASTAGALEPTQPANIATQQKITLFILNFSIFMPEPKQAVLIICHRCPHYKFILSLVFRPFGNLRFGFLGSRLSPNSLSFLFFVVESITVSTGQP